MWHSDNCANVNDKSKEHSLTSSNKKVRSIKGRIYDLQLPIKRREEKEEEKEEVLRWKLIEI